MNTQLKNSIEQYLFERYTYQTAQSYLYIITRFTERHPNAHQLKLRAIESYLAGLKAQNHTVSYRNVTLSAIKSFYDFLIETNKIQSHPCKSLFFSEKRPTGKNFNDMLLMEDMETLFSVLPTRYKCTINRNKAIVGLLIYQGITSQELVNLKLQDLDLDEGTVYISPSPKKRSRTLSLKPNQITPLINYLNKERVKLTHDKYPYLMVSMRGMKMTVDSLHSIIDRMQGAFDKNISPKQIRQSVINYWLNKRKIPLEDVQIMAGHRYPSSTEKYIQKDSTKQREVINRLCDDILGGVK